jgi:hypothetical protein
MVVVREATETFTAQRPRLFGLAYRVVPVT